MGISVAVLKIFLPLLYLAAVGAYGWDFFNESGRARALKTPLLVVTLILHLYYLVGRTILFGHPPITTIYEIMSMVAFSIAAAYWIIEYRTKIKSTGFFILTLALAFQIYSSVLIEDISKLHPVLRDALLGVHVPSAMLGIAAFAISGVYGFLYLILYHNLKSRRFGIIYSRLPDLEKLEAMTIVAITSGFVLLTVAALFGIAWLSKAFDSVSYSDPKLIGTLLIWGMYAAGLIARRVLGWHGRKMMLLSITGFLFSFLSLTLINLYFSSFHRFY